MLTLEDKYARLAIGADDAFQDVTESVRSLFQICRLNELEGALVVSEQDDFDWRSSLRVAVRFYRVRYTLPPLRLALVKPGAAPRIAAEVVDFVAQAGLACACHGSEAEALVWLNGARS
jgi:hypothetical protein